MDQFGFSVESFSSGVNFDAPGIFLKETAIAGAVHRGGLGRRSLERALLFMEQHLGEPIALGEIAAAACLSRAHFARMFRISTGVSVMTYLMQMRIDHAKSQLMSGELNLAELACALGFCDQSHFCRVFRRAVGIPPGRYARDGIARPHLRSSPAFSTSLRSAAGATQF